MSASGTPSVRRRRSRSVRSAAISQAVSLAPNSLALMTMWESRGCSASRLIAAPWRVMPPERIEGAELDEQSSVPRRRPPAGGGSSHRSSDGSADARGGQVERERRQVGLEDLGG